MGLTESKVPIKKKYIENNTYKLEFFELPGGYEKRILSYLQEKHLKSSYPIRIKSGELQATCLEFISKCRELEKNKQESQLPVPPSLNNIVMVQRAIALIKHKQTQEVAIVCNSESMPSDDFIRQLFNMTAIVVVQHAILLNDQVSFLFTQFYNEFSSCKSTNSDLGLVWYRVDDSLVIVAATEECSTQHTLIGTLV